MNGLNDPNPYGERALTNNDPAKPNEAYFKHVDYVVNKAEELGLFVGMLPTWGNNWNKAPGQGGIFTPENAGAYGEFLGKRYKDKPIIWILGGDRPVENDTHRATLKAMALGLRKGDGGSHLITFHPPGGSGSSTWFDDADWLDFNMRQNGHAIDFDGRYDATRADYARSNPVKPVIDGEPVYEDHPVNFRPKELGHSVAADVRRPLYWDLFGGACGHTYGHHSVWQMYAPGRNPVNGPLMPWTEAIDQPGAGQIAARPRPDRVAATADARAGRFNCREEHGTHERPRRRHPPVHRDARPGGDVRVRVRPGRPGVLRTNGCHQGARGNGVVVRPADGQGRIDREI